jgi:hypothetical protein
MAQVRVRWRRSGPGTRSSEEAVTGALEGDLQRFTVDGDVERAAFFVSCALEGDMRRFAGGVAGADFSVSFVSFVRSTSTVRLLRLRRLFAFLMCLPLTSAALTGFLDFVLSPLSFGLTFLGCCWSPLGCFFFFFFFFFKVVSTFTDELLLVEKTNTSSRPVAEVAKVFSSAQKLAAEVQLKLCVKLRLEVSPLPLSWRPWYVELLSLRFKPIVASSLLYGRCKM